MKRQLLNTVALLGLFGGTLVASAPAQANNPGVQAALAGYSDISTFYAALLNTGVINELDPNTHYTIFAPTNDAFAEIRPNLYPCFYSTQCRAQVADVLRDHIAVGRRTLTEMIHEPEVPTIGHFRVYAESPYVGQYAIGNQAILSAADVHGDMIYRLDGVIISNQQLTQFRNPPPVANAVQEKTVVTYRTSSTNPVPGGNYPAGATETVTERTYVTPGAPSSTTVVYPNGASSDGGETTTVTRRVTTRP